MARQLTTAALCAKEIREYLKEQGIKASVRSKNFSMGNDVRVEVYNQPPNVIGKIRKDLAKYQYGYFDGMVDMYEYSNWRDDIPQTKYLFIDNEYSPEIKQAALNFIRKHFSGGNELPEKYADVTYRDLIFNESLPAIIHRLLCGDYGLDDLSTDFWKEWSN